MPSFIGTETDRVCEFELPWKAGESSRYTIHPEMPFGLVAVACTDKGVGEGPTCGDCSVTVVALASGVGVFIAVFAEVCDPPPHAVRTANAISSIRARNFAIKPLSETKGEKLKATSASANRSAALRNLRR